MKKTEIYSVYATGLETFYTGNFSNHLKYKSYKGSIKSSAQWESRLLSHLAIFTCVASQPCLFGGEIQMEFTWNE